MQAAYFRDGITIDEVMDLSRKIAGAYSGFVPQASKSVAHIVMSAVCFVFQV